MHCRCVPSRSATDPPSGTRVARHPRSALVGVLLLATATGPAGLATGTIVLSLAAVMTAAATYHVLRVRAFAQHRARGCGHRAGGERYRAPATRSTGFAGSGRRVRMLTGQRDHDGERLGHGREACPDGLKYGDSLSILSGNLPGQRSRLVRSDSVRMVGKTTIMLISMDCCSR
jgi:hypothetical protein